MATIAERLKKAASQAYGNVTKAAKDYLSPDTKAAAKDFDYDNSAKKRADSARKLKELNERTASGQRVSGRAASRTRDIARIEGRSDEEKIKSKAIGNRNSKVIQDAASFIAPGGAAGAIAAKAGYIKKGVSLAKNAAKAASKLGKGSIKKGVKSAAQVAANRAKKAGAKNVAKAALKKGLKGVKYKAKVTAKGNANQYASTIGGGSSSNKA